MPVENWDGARIRFNVERRPGTQASVAGRVGGLIFFPSQGTQLNVLVDPVHGWTWEAQEKAGSPGRQAGTR